jgi:hypothetical protein
MLHRIKCQDEENLDENREEDVLPTGTFLVIVLVNHGAPERNGS